MTGPTWRIDVGDCRDLLAPSHYVCVRPRPSCEDMTNTTTTYHCTVCDGFGKIDGDYCPACDGIGVTAFDCTDCGATFLIDRRGYSEGSRGTRCEHCGDREALRVGVPGA